MKKIVSFIICVCFIFTFASCDIKSNHSETESLRDNNIVAIHVGNSEVLIDEARYYAYTAQGTYEVSYLAEGKEIDWNAEMNEGVTWQKAVKSMALDDICRRECMYSLAKDYNISLSEDEKKDISKKVDEFYKNSNSVLKEKINIKRERLESVFQKEIIAKKVEEKMTQNHKNLADKTYENWKTGNTVTAEKEWQNITFEKPIFQLEDIH